MAAGERLEAEVDCASLFKIDILAKHHGAVQVNKQRAESGHLVVTLVKE